MTTSADGIILLEHKKGGIMKHIILASLFLLLYAGASLACDCDPVYGLLNRMPSRLTVPWEPPKKADESKGFDKQQEQDATPKSVGPRTDVVPGGTGQK